MANESIETLTVELVAEYDKLLSGTKEGVSKAEKELDKLSQPSKKAQAGFEQFGGYLKGQFLGIITSVGAAFAAAFAAQNIVSFFSTITKASIDANKQFEVFASQFETLLGSAGAAQKRIDELAEFSAKTPFELDEIVRADKLLQTFGGNVLATGKNLEMIGDIAAGVNQPFEDVAMWVGRAYDAMQSGRPWGESAMRLQEMGAMSGKARAELEKMQKEGASGAEMWERFNELVGDKFEGAMEKLSKTLQGIMSNLADFRSMLLREGGEELFAGVKEDAEEFYEIVNQPEAKESLIDLAKAAGSIADALRESVTSPILEGLKDIDPEEVEKLADSLEDFAVAVGKLLDSDTADINSVVTALTTVTDLTTVFINQLSSAKEMLAAGGQAAAGFVAPITNLAFGWNALNDALEKFTGNNVSDATRSLVNSQEEATDQADELAAAYADYGRTLQEAAAAQRELADTKAAEELAKIAEEAEKAASALDAAKEAASDLAVEFGEAIKENKAAVEELEADHGEKIVEITEDYKEEQADIVAERDEALIDLEKETAKKRQDIMESTQEALAKLEKDTAKRREEINEKTQDSLSKLRGDTEDSIAKVRQDHQVKEKRETEDHQRDMKRLQNDYLFDLQDAVKSRDARAIVDLRRRFQREKREREQDFKVNQKREDADVGDKIGEIRQDERKRRQEILKNQQQQLEDLAESEAEKREEIMASQAEQLEDLAEHEAEKREQIEESYNEQMEKAEEKYQEEMERENERYEERKQALDEALQKRLEDVAKELADEKDINEKGAKAILEALMKTFGVGGDIDKMMEDFAARRQQKLTIQIDVENDIRDMPGSEDRGTPNERGRMGPPPRRFAKGGLVPGPINAPMDAIVHGGEWVIPHEDVMEMIMTRQSNATGAMNHRFAVDVNMKGIPANMDQRSLENVVAGIFNRALNEAGIGK